MFVTRPLKTCPLDQFFLMIKNMVSDFAGDQYFCMIFTSKYGGPSFFLILKTSFLIFKNSFFSHKVF